IKFLLSPVSLSKKSTDRLAFLVHQEAARNAIDILERHQIIREQGVTNYHFVRMVRLAGPVLGQPFCEPQGQKPVRRKPVIPDDSEHLRIREDVHELVPNDTSELVDVAVGRNNDSTLQELEEPSHPSRDEARRNVRLLEMQIGRIEDEGRTMIQ